MTNNNTQRSLAALSAPSREKVNEFVRKAVDAGGKILRDPIDYAWMYSQSVEDLDGHIWDIFWMDESKKPKQ